MTTTSNMITIPSLSHEALEGIRPIYRWIAEFMKARADKFNPLSEGERTAFIDLFELADSDRGMAAVEKSIKNLSGCRSEEEIYEKVMEIFLEEFPAYRKVFEVVARVKNKFTECLLCDEFYEALESSGMKSVEAVLIKEGQILLAEGFDPDAVVD